LFVNGRDDKTQEARELIKLYYHWNPVIVQVMETDEEFKKEIKAMIGEIIPLIRRNAE